MGHTSKNTTKMQLGFENFSSSSPRFFYTSQKFDFVLDKKFGS
jgi:hypothetical protein